MTNRVSYAPQDFQKMCKQAERDLESKKLIILMERVKKQIAERENPQQISRTAASGRSSEVGEIRMPSRSAPFDR